MCARRLKRSRGVERLAQAIAQRINDRWRRDQDKQFALVQEYQAMRREKFKRNAE
jgi:hypothetical protein